MSVKTNYLTFILLSLCFLFTSSTCKNQRDSKQGVTKDSPSSEQPDESDNANDGAELQRILGNPVSAARAKALTDNYWNTLNPTTRDDDAKSVYFTKAELDLFAKKIIDNELCTADKIGFRFYFAKYNPSDTTFPGQNTIVIRATCDGKDIAHQIQGQLETVNVAYDFGDVCPPRCDLKNPDIEKHDGTYNTAGNCNGCPPN